MAIAQGKTALIVDDSPILRKSLRTILEKNGFTVSGEAANGVEAFKLFKESKPDLVTIDILMPQMGGIETLRFLKGLDPDVKAVMVSSLSEKEKVVECAKAGASHYILKPFDEGKVLEVLEKVLPA
jgi:two-component system chemotaxis response regulator CheY